MEIFETIPVIKTLFIFPKTYTAVKDLLFGKKLVSFLFSLKDLPQDKRINEIIKLEDDPKHEYKVGEKIIFLIGKIEDANKASILGKLFKFLLEEKLNFSEFIRASKALDILYLEYFNQFINDNWEDTELEQAEELMSAGLVKASLKPYTQTHGIASPKIICKPSDLGLKLQSLLKNS